MGLETTLPNFADPTSQYWSSPSVFQANIPFYPDQVYAEICHTKTIALYWLTNGLKFNCAEVIYSWGTLAYRALGPHLKQFAKIAGYMYEMSKLRHQEGSSDSSILCGVDVLGHSQRI